MNGGRQIGSEYRVESILGQGASGTVWLGHDRGDRPWAVKVLREELATDPGVVHRFVREREVLASIRHPHVVGVHDLVIEGSTLAIVMDLVEGPDLRTVLRRRGTVEPATVVRWGGQIAGALAAAHAAGVLHRDVKPENVLVVQETGDALLTDFGIARLMEGAARSMTLVGTPLYMAPEVAEDEPLTAAVDLYALGVLLYELCCGVSPFAGHSSMMATLRAHALEVPGRPEGIPDRLWQLIDELLEKDPRHRPAGADTVAARLAAMAPDVAEVPAAPLRRQPPPIRRHLGTPPEQRLGGTQMIRPVAPLAASGGYVGRVEEVSAQVPARAFTTAIGDRTVESEWDEGSSRRIPAMVAGATLCLVVCGAAVVYAMGRGSETQVPTSRVATPSPTAPAPTGPTPSIVSTSAPPTSNTSTAARWTPTSPQLAAPTVLPATAPSDTSRSTPSLPVPSPSPTRKSVVATPSDAPEEVETPSPTKKVVGPTPKKAVASKVENKPVTDPVPDSVVVTDSSPEPDPDPVVDPEPPAPGPDPVKAQEGKPVPPPPWPGHPS